jgi:ABC-type arginine transport system permease subunit
LPSFHASQRRQRRQIPDVAVIGWIDVMSGANVSAEVTKAAATVEAFYLIVAEIFVYLRHGLERMCP